MKKIVCLITALFLLISVIPGSAAGAEMVNPTVVYMQDFESVDTPQGAGFAHSSTAAQYRGTIVSPSTDCSFVQDFNYNITSAADAGFTVTDAKPVATHSYNGKLVVNKTETGQGTTDNLNLKSYIDGIDSYTVKFDLSANFSGSSMVIYHGAGFEFVRKSTSTTVYDIKYYKDATDKFVTTGKTVDLGSTKVFYINVTTVNGVKYAELKIGNETIINNVAARDGYSFLNLSFNTNGGLKGTITVDNIKVTQNNVSGTDKSMKIYKYEPGSFSYLFDTSSYTKGKNYEIEFNLIPKLTAGSIAFFDGSMYQLEMSGSNYQIKYRNAADSTMNETTVKNIAMGTPIKIKLFVNREKATTDFYANDVLICSDVPKRTDGSPALWYNLVNFGITLNNGMRGSVYIDDIKITRDTANEIVASETETTCKASAYVTDGVLVIASYSADGKVLENVDYKAVTNSTAEVEIAKDDSLTYKAFIFDNFSNLKPLCDVTAYGVGDL